MNNLLKDENSFQFLDEAFKMLYTYKNGTYNNLFKDVGLCDVLSMIIF